MFTPTGIYLFKVNYEYIRAKCKTCLELTIKQNDVTEAILAPLILTLNGCHKCRQSQF